MSERHLADLAEVEAKAVERRLDGEVELRRGRELVFLGLRLLVRRRLVLLAFDELDVVIDEVGVEVLDLLLRQLDVVEPVDDLVVGEEPLLGSVRDELLELFDLGERDLDGEQVGDLRLVLNDVRTTNQTCRGRASHSRPHPQADSDLSQLLQVRKEKLRCHEVVTTISPTARRE